MIVKNNTDHAIYVGDIGVNIPSAKGGPFVISDEVAAKSDQLGTLIKGEVVFAYPHSGKEPGSLHRIAGTTIWEGNGKTSAVVKGDFSVQMSFDDFNELRKGYIKGFSKRYVIRRSCQTNISLEKIGHILTKQSPACEISEEYYNSSEIQTSIAAGRISLSTTLYPFVNSQGVLTYGEIDKRIAPAITESYEKLSEYKDVNCMWEGPIFDAGGYANMNRQYILNLDRLGASVRPTSMNSGNEIEKDLREKILRIAQSTVRPNSPKVYATNVPGRHSGKSIAYTMMETELCVHKDLANSMKVADELWVPSEWNKTIFSNAGVTRPIMVMPLGVDGELYKPRAQSVFFSFPVKRYVFYAVSTWIWRKGWDVLLKAYSRAFTADDDVSLVIFSHVPLQRQDKFTEHIRNHVNSMFSGRDRSNFPNLSVITSVLPASIVPLIYNSANCFVLFSRGEGWGLPYCEAAASGLPVIGADHGGQKMFLNKDNSLLVEPDLVVTCHPSLLYMSPFYKGMKFVSYSDKAICDAADKMRYAYEHQDEMKEKATLCRDNLLQNFTWDKCARRVADRLREIQ